MRKRTFGTILAGGALALGGTLAGIAASSTSTAPAYPPGIWWVSNCVSAGLVAHEGSYKADLAWTAAVPQAGQCWITRELPKGFARCTPTKKNCQEP